MASTQKLKVKIPKIPFIEKYKVWNMKEKYDFYGIKKIGYLDIETSGLNADFDIILIFSFLIRH